MVSVRVVDPGFLGSAGLFGNPFSWLRTLAIAPDCAVPQLAVPPGAFARRAIATISLWPERFWFWLGTAALVAALTPYADAKSTSAAKPRSINSRPV